MLEHRERECSRCFDVGEMCGVLEDHLSRVGDTVNQRSPVVRSGRGVVGAGDHERRCLDLTEPLAEVKPADRRVAAA